MEDEPTQERHRLKAVEADILSDTSLTTDRGWCNMDVKWLITRESLGATKTVVGRTIFPPNAKHELHRHPRAEEWEYILQGEGIKRIGDEAIRVRKGDIVFVPEDVYHALENDCDTNPLVTIWGYCGAGSLEEAGYILPTDDAVAGEGQ